MAFVDSQQPLTGATTKAEYGEKIDYMNLGARFKKHLEYAYLKASEEERKRCAEALSAVGRVESQIKRRPYTAVPILENDIGQDGYKAPFATTYKKEYFAKQHPITIATRPKTTHTSFAPVRPMNENTHYDVEFSRKTPNPNLPYRTGTASGNRSNNPHPAKQFLSWKFPTNLKAGPRDLVKENVTDARLNEIHRRLCRSTYQSDYLGMPQGYEISENGYSSMTLADKPPYTLDTFHRSTYQSPHQQELLRLTTSRYGSNGHKRVPAYGTIPLANGTRYYVDKRTTYDRYYNGNNGSLVNTNQFADLLQNTDINHSGRVSSRRSIIPVATPVTTFTTQPVL